MNSCEHGLTDVEPWYPGLPILLGGGMVQSMMILYWILGTEYTLQGIVNTNITNHKLIIKDFLHPERLNNVYSTGPTTFIK